MSETRRVRVRALAKINLGLRVIGRRPDGYHELRTVFQTISLGDTLEIAFTRARRTRIELSADLEIPDNLAARAAELALHAMRVAGHLQLRLTKKIPLGAGLGGGSSDAAAVLLALPVLAGGAIPFERLLRLGAELGSDVPFFLLGGTAVGIGRGTELFPSPDMPRKSGLLLVPRLHVSTADAYRALGLTSEFQQNKIVSFQSQLWGPGPDAPVNDFEGVVFERYPQLGRWKRRLLQMGAKPALMSGSGSALFGLFRTPEEVSRALNSLREEQAFPFSLVSRQSYRRMWWRWLAVHLRDKLWPPPSRYVR